MIVLDASVAVLGLMANGPARELMATEWIVCPHLADTEVADAFRKLVLRGAVTPKNAAAAIRRWSRLGIERVAAGGLLERVWELRENVTGYDATYVAMAEALGVPLATADVRLAGALGPRCQITVLRA